MTCEGCGSEIIEGAKAHYHDDGVATCRNCAPTLEASLISSEERINGEDDDPVLTAAVAVRVARRLASGAKLQDADVW